MPNPYGYSPPFVAGFGLKRRPCRQTSVYPPPKSPSLEWDLPRPALRELVFFCMWVILTLDLDYR